MTSYISWLRSGFISEYILGQRILPRRSKAALIGVFLPLLAGCGTITTLSTTPNPAIVGQTITAKTIVQHPKVDPLFGTIMVPVPGGTVTLRDASTGTVLGTEPTSDGIANFSLMGLTPGFHSLTATYNGDGPTYPISTSPALGQVVGIGGSLSSSITLTPSSNPANYGQSVTFTATVAAIGPALIAPTGSVTFADATTVLATVALTGGAAAFTTSTLPGGSDTITAYYTGDSNFAPSTASVTQNVKPYYQTYLTSSLNPSAVGQSVTFTATVAFSGTTLTPTGQVQFAVDGTNVGRSVALSNGHATDTETGLTPGTHTVTVAYIPFLSLILYPGGKTASLTQTVNSHLSLLWTSTNGAASLWAINPDGTRTISPTSGPYPGWTARAIAEGPDGHLRLLWTNTDGRASLWNLADPSPAATCRLYGPYAGWTATALAVGPDNAAHLLWNNADGRVSLWNMNDPRPADTCLLVGPYAGWSGTAIAIGPDNHERLLWNSVSGQMSLWNLADPQPANSCLVYGPYADWTAMALAVGPDNAAHLLWDNTDGRVSLWNMADARPSDTCLFYGPYSGWSGRSIAFGSNGQERLLWDNTGSSASLWNLSDPSPASSCFVSGPNPGWTAVGISAGP